MATSCAPTTQPRNHRERVLAQDAMNNQAFPMHDLLKPRCKKTAAEMRADMDRWGSETATPETTAFGKICKEYRADKFGDPKGAVSNIVAAEIPSTAHAAPFVSPQVRPARASSIVSVPVDAEVADPVALAFTNATIAIQEGKRRPRNHAAELVALYKEGGWVGMDDAERNDAAFEVLTDDYAWSLLKIHEKADIARPLTVVSPLQTEKDENGNTVFFAYVDSMRSNIRYKVCFSKVGHVFTVFAPTQDQQARIAGKLTYHMVLFHMTHERKLQAECGKIIVPWEQKKPAPVPATVRATWSDPWEEARKAAERNPTSTEDFD